MKDSKLKADPHTGDFLKEKRKTLKATEKSNQMKT